MSAGARLTVIRLSGSAKPALASAAWIRWRPSRTAPLGRPTVAKEGRPLLMSTSTSPDRRRCRDGGGTNGGEHAGHLARSPTDYGGTPAARGSRARRPDHWRARRSPPIPAAAASAHSRSRCMRRLIAGILLLSSATGVRRAQGGGRAVGADRTRVGGADARAVHRVVAEDRGLLRPERRHGEGQVLRGGCADRGDRAQRHDRPRLVGAAGQLGSTSPPTRWARSGWCGTRCCTHCSSAARHPNKKFVDACHLASIEVWRDSTLRADPSNPQGR